MNKTLHILSITLISLNIASLASNDNNNNNLIINNNNNNSSSSSSNSAINTNSTDLYKQFLNKLGIKPNKLTPMNHEYYDESPQSLNDTIKKIDHVKNETLIPALTLLTKINNSDVLSDNLIRMFLITKLANGIIMDLESCSSTSISSPCMTTFTQALKALQGRNHSSLRRRIFNLMDEKPQEIAHPKQQTSSFSTKKKWLGEFKKQLKNGTPYTSQALIAVHNSMFEQHKEQLTKNRNKTQAFTQPFTATLNDMINAHKNSPTNNDNTSGCTPQ